MLGDELAPDIARRMNPPTSISFVDWKGFSARIDYPALTK